MCGQRPVRERMKKDLEVINTTKKRKLEYLGHIMRNESKYHLLRSVLQGKDHQKESKYQDLKT